MNIIARLTRDAEIRATATGKEVVNFSVAVNDSYKNKQGERTEQATYFDCDYWRSAGVAKALKKGMLVELTGRVSARAWLGKDGEPKAALNFHVSQIKFHSGSKKNETSQAATKANNSRLIPAEAADDLPF